LIAEIFWVTIDGDTVEMVDRFPVQDGLAVYNGPALTSPQRTGSDPRRPARVITTVTDGVAKIRGAYVRPFADHHLTWSLRSGQPLFEVVVHELNGDGALADGRRNAFDRPVAHVTGREDAGDAGLQQ